jgi:hypothetical protein
MLGVRTNIIRKNHVQGVHKIVNAARESACATSYEDRRFETIGGCAGLRFLRKRFTLLLSAQQKLAQIKRNAKASLAELNNSR